MVIINFTFWNNGDFFIGYLSEFPDYETQGHSLSELQENLKDLYQDLTSDKIPFIRKTMALSL